MRPWLLSCALFTLFTLLAASSVTLASAPEDGNDDEFYEEEWAPPAIPVDAIPPLPIMAPSELCDYLIWAEDNRFVVEWYGASEELAGEVVMLDRSFPEGDNVTAVAVTEAGWVAIGTDGGLIEVFRQSGEGTEWEYIFNISWEIPTVIHRLAFAEGEYLAWASTDGRLGLYQKDPAHPDGPWLRRLGRNYSNGAVVTALALGRDGSLLHGNTRGRIERLVLQQAQGEGEWEYEVAADFTYADSGPITLLELDSGGEHLLIGHATGDYRLLALEDSAWTEKESDSLTDISAIHLARFAMDTPAVWIVCGLGGEVRLHVNGVAGPAVDTRFADGSPAITIALMDLLGIGMVGSMSDMIMVEADNLTGKWAAVDVTE